MTQEPGKQRASEGKPERRRISRRKLLAGAGIGAAGAVTAGVLLDDRWNLQLSRVTVRLKRLAKGFDGFTIAHLTDLHRGAYVPESFIDRAAKATNAARPDLIALTGDYVTRNPRNAASCARALAQLSAPHGVVAVLGNHDYWTDPDVVAHVLRDTAGVRVLKNQRELLERSGDYLMVAGLDDPVTRNHDLGRTLGGVSSSGPVVLLAHTPDIAPEAAKLGVDLVLAGHTHGGQVVLPWLGPPIVNSKYGKRFAAGLAEVQGTKVYTNRGVGMAIVPIRVNCPPEVALITLRRAG